MSRPDPVAGRETVRSQDTSAREADSRAEISVTSDEPLLMCGGPQATYVIELPSETDTPLSAEQEARDMLKRIGVENAQSFTSGNLVELANLIASNRQRGRYDRILEQEFGVARSRRCESCQCELPDRCMECMRARLAELTEQIQRSRAASPQETTP